MQLLFANPTVFGELHEFTVVYLGEKHSLNERVNGMILLANQWSSINT